MDNEESGRFLAWLQNDIVSPYIRDERGFNRRDQFVLLCWLAEPGERRLYDNSERRAPRVRRGIRTDLELLKGFIEYHRPEWNTDAIRLAMEKEAAVARQRAAELHHPDGPATPGTACSICEKEIGDLSSVASGATLLLERVCGWDCHRALIASRGRSERRAREKDAYVEAVVAQRVFDRDGWTCMLCGEPLDRDVEWDQFHPPGQYPTIDHIVPLRLGGEHSYANTQAAHWACNVRKGAQEPPEGEGKRLPDADWPWGDWDD